VRLPWLRRHRREDASVEVALPFAQTRWEPEQLLSGPAVTLGFRDGSTMDLSPESADGQALRKAASVLVDRDPAR
jgi:hypothetical protein